MAHHVVLSISLHLISFVNGRPFRLKQPFKLARRVPRDTWKTVTDAWNGYHSVPLRESDGHSRHLLPHSADGDILERLKAFCSLVMGIIGALTLF